MSWLELRIQASRTEAASLEAALEALGALSVTFQDSADTPIFEPALGETPLWDQTRVTGLFDATTQTADIERKLELFERKNWHWHILEDKDWEREWMQHFHPIQCHDNLWICPSWLSPPDPNATNVMLDPGLAFGTGTHPTTFLCLKWLAQQGLNGHSVIDYGCGSGILGVASLLLGAGPTYGIDIDPQALLASRDNAARNALEANRFPVFLPDEAPGTKADILVANILAGPLVQLAPALIELLLPGGRLCMSGILASQAQTVIDAYQHRIEFAQPLVKDGWVLLHGRVRDHKGS